MTALTLMMTWTWGFLVVALLKTLTLMSEESDIQLPEADLDSEVWADPVHRRNTQALKDKLA